MLGSHNLQQLLMAELAALDASLETESLIYVVLGTCLALSGFSLPRSRSLMLLHYILT